MTPIAVVTGGAGGMGLETARILGRDHRIVLTDVDRERLDDAVRSLGELGIEASATVCDITDRESVDALFEATEADGHIRAVVHTAGVSPQMGSPDFIARVNAVGTVNIVEAYLPIASEGDVIVNVASIAGHMTPDFLLPTRAFRLARTDAGRLGDKLVAKVKFLPKAAGSGAVYSSSKAFVIWYSREMAADFGARGARILSVSPGSFDTAMGRLEEKSGSGDLIEHAALKRFGKPKEVAEVLAFAASDKPGYLTGIDILVDGGTKAGLDWRGLLAMARS